MKTVEEYREEYATKFGLPLEARWEHAKDAIERAVKELFQQHPYLGINEMTGRALARLDAKVHRREQAKALIAPTGSPVGVTGFSAPPPVSYRRELWAIIALLVLLILSGRAHAQVDAVRVSASGVQKKQWAGGIAKLDFGTGLVVDCISTPGTCSVTAGGGGTGILTLNGLTADPQTFAKVNDTNVTLTIGSVTSTHTWTMGWTGSLSVARGGTGSAANTGSAGKVLIGNGSGAFIEGDPLVQGLTAHDAAGSSTNPVAVGGYASAAAPTDVSTDVDIVRAWFLKNGAQVFGIQAAGALIGGDAANGLDVDVTRVSGNVAITVADGANTTLGAKADAKSTATDTTAVTAMQVLKQISASVQAPPSQAVTNAGTFATQAAATEADGANVTLGAKADAKSTATDTTAVTAMQVLKQISASVQAPPSQAVTNAGTFATQSAITAASGSIASGALASGSIASGAVASGAVSSGAFASGSVSDGAVVTLGAKTDAKSTSTDATSITIMQVLKEISAMVQAPATTPASQSGTWTVQPGNTANTTPWLTTDSATSATGAAVPAKASYTGGAGSGATGGFVVGIPVGDTYKNINVSTATTTLLVTGVSGRQVRISALHMITSIANNVAFIEGTGATCGTGTAGMAGGTTAASGYNLAANGGIAFGSGLGTVMQTATTGDSVCVVTSAAAQLSGGLQYTIY
jgi:hypothetical protein